MSLTTRVVITDGKDFMEVEPVDAAEHAAHGWRRATDEEIAKHKAPAEVETEVVNDNSTKKNKKIPGQSSAPVLTPPAPPAPPAPSAE